MVYRADYTHTEVGGKCTVIVNLDFLTEMLIYLCYVLSTYFGIFFKLIIDLFNSQGLTGQNVK